MFGPTLLNLAEFVGLARDEEPNNEAKKTKNGAEDFNHQDLDEAARMDKSAACPKLDCFLWRRNKKIAQPNAYREGSAASARAAPLPLMPTATPQTRLHMPTVIPDQKRAYPV
jgi:hypothetical protein